MQEYTDQAKLKELVVKYSEFINYPIYLYTSKEVDVPVEEEEEEEKETEEKKEEGAEDVEDEEGKPHGKASARLLFTCVMLWMAIMTASYFV